MIAQLRASTCLLALACAAPAMAQAGEAAQAAPTGQAAPAAPPTEPAQPPAQPSAPAGIADIVVTAQRRAESLQKAALTVEVLDRRSLAVGGVTAPAQLTSVLPTVQVSTAGPSTGVYVRGVGGFAGGGLTSPAVPYYFDGIYVARTQSVTSEFYDVERLELVKGPQGTLYGRNASGGAVNVLTNRPRLGRTEGRFEVEVGNYGNQSGEAAINLPLGSTVAIRASGTIVDKGGYTSIGLGDDIHRAGRVKLLWEPSTDISLLLNASYGEIGGDGGGFVALNREIPGWYPWLDASDPRSQAFTAATAVVPVPGFVRPTSRSDAQQDLSFYNLSAQLDWSFGTTTLTIIPAYRYSKISFAALLGFLLEFGGDEFGGLPTRPETSKATSIEARLSGDSDRLKWVAGLYYFNEDQYQQTRINMGFLSNNAIEVSPTATSYAAFGQATVSLAERFRLIGGLRYTSDRRGLDGNFYLVSPAVFLGPPPPSAAACAFPFPTRPNCLIDTFKGRKTFNNLSWKAGFEADVLDDSLLYATASRGFKAGGFNQQSTPGRPGEAQPFKPEILTSYEAGLKSRFLNNRLQVNVSGFYWDYRDHQEPFITPVIPGVSGQLYFNTGKIEIYGGNLDVIARLWSGGTLSGSLEYAHSRYKDYTFQTPTFAYSPASLGCPVVAQNPAVTTLDCSGYEVSRTPKFAGRVAIEQAIDLGTTGTLIANGSVSFASARWLGTDFIPAERVSGYGKLDASLTYRDPSNRWTLTGFVRNINNAKVYSEAAKIPFSALIYANIQPPRTYGARLGFSF